QIRASSGTTVPHRARRESVEASIESDEVKKIAVLTGGRVGPFAGRALAGVGSSQTNEEAVARCIPHIADELVTSFTPAVRLGLRRRRRGPGLRGRASHAPRP